MAKYIIFYKEPSKLVLSFLLWNEGTLLHWVAHVQHENRQSRTEPFHMLRSPTGHIWGLSPIAPLSKDIPDVQLPILLLFSIVGLVRDRTGLYLCKSHCHWKVTCAHRPPFNLPTTMWISPTEWLQLHHSLVLPGGKAPSAACQHPYWSITIGFVPVGCYPGLSLPDVLMVTQFSCLVADSCSVEFKTRSEKRQPIFRNRGAVSHGDNAECKGEQIHYRCDRENRPQEYTSRPLYLWRCHTIGLFWSFWMNNPQNISFSLPHSFPLRFSGVPPSLVL